MSSSAKILVVDDTRINIEILNELLGDKYNVLSALDGEFALEIAHDDTPDLILLDIMMPEMNGYEVCRRLKEDKATRDIPVIFITAITDEEAIERAYDMGGVDYVIKPFRPKELLARVKRELELHRYIMELKESKDKLKLLASTDPMTNLYNRRYFSGTSKHILELAKRNSTDLSIIMFDLDNFKNINDIYGHAIGDSVIVAFANILKTHQRTSDIICRFGGEEFVVLLPETNLKGALVVAEKIRVELESTEILLDSDRSIQLTVSAGVTDINVSKEADIEASIRRSDEALYIAKNSGRNRVCLY
jgi:diguanylate cyclase (GGDEF)-like protein